MSALLVAAIVNFKF